LDGVQQISVSSLISLEDILDGLNVLLLLFQFLGCDVFIGLADPGNTNEDESLEEILEEVVAIDGPQCIIIVDGSL
jgi:hypothetical protein